jgi:hypothetical protein
MRIRRGLLFWGLFLIPLGGITLLVRAGILDPGQLSEAWRLWPLILVGIGLAIILGRSRTAVVGTAVIALVLGSLGGAALASDHSWLGTLTECGGTTAADQHLQQTGALASGATVRLELNCGTLTLGAATGAAWQLDAAYRGPVPVISTATDRLEIRTPSASGDRRNDWTVTVPAAAVGNLDVSANAASATLRLPGTHLANLDAQINAGDLRIDGTQAAFDEVDLSVNAGRIRLDAGASAMTGDLSVNAGAIDLCVPDGLGLRLDVTDQLTFVTNLGSRGLAQSGHTWTRPAASGQPTIDLSIDGSAASFSLNPTGGCR